MARTISYMQAINEALAQDETVVLFGEDNVGGAGSLGEMDAWGGVMGVTRGLYAKYPERILDTPISESAFIGAAGAACSGLRPVAELMFVDIFGVCMDRTRRHRSARRWRTFTCRIPTGSLRLRARRRGLLNGAP